MSVKVTFNKNTNQFSITDSILSEGVTVNFGDTIDEGGETYSFFVDIETDPTVFESNGIYEINEDPNG